MKCQRCNGAGKYTNAFGDIVRCDRCYGTGKVEYGENDRLLPMGEQKPLTNEEWFCGLSTGEKAKWLSQRSQILYDCGQRDVFPKIMYEEDWEWWLKQPHREG